MPWFVVGILSPLLSSIGVYIDKILIERFTKRGAAVGVLALYSSLFSIVVCVVLGIWHPSAFSIPLSLAGLLIVAGIIDAVSILLYLNAMKEEDASTIVPIFQTIPFFSLVLGFLILGETLALPQIFLIGLVVLGSIVLTFDHEARGLRRIKWVPLLLMLSASFTFTLYDALFKLGALESLFWPAVFWQHVGIAGMGLCIYFCMPRLRRAFHTNVRENGATVVSLNLTNEILYTLGIMAYSYALLLAPIALVATVTAYQPMFVFIIGIALTLFFPHILKEDLRLRIVLQKIIGILIIVSASMVLTLSG